MNEPIIGNKKLVSKEEIETNINIDHYNQVFDVYTTCLKTSSSLLKIYPDYYQLSDDKASATANNIPLKLITKLSRSSLRGKQ